MKLNQIYKSYEDEKILLWYENNCFSEENLEEVNEILLKPFKIKPILDGDSLLIEYGLNIYKIEIDKENMRLILGQRNNAANPKGLEKYRYLSYAGDNSCFKGDNAWYDLIHWVAKRGKK